MATKSALYFSLWVMKVSFTNDLRRHQVEEEAFATLALNILFIFLLNLHFQAKCCSKLTPVEDNQVRFSCTLPFFEEKFEAIRTHHPN